MRPPPPCALAGTRPQLVVETESHKSVTVRLPFFGRAAGNALEPNEIKKETGLSIVLDIANFLTFVKAKLLCLWRCQCISVEHTWRTSQQTNTCSALAIQWMPWPAGVQDGSIGFQVVSSQTWMSSCNSMPAAGAAIVEGSASDDD